MTRRIPPESAAALRRLEAERLRPQPPEPATADLLQELIGLLHAAIRDDQKAGKWGKR